MPGVRRLLALVGWVVGLVAVLLAMTAVGHGALAGPALDQPATWAEWAAARSPAEATVAVLRLVVLALAWYLLATTVLAVATRLIRVGQLVAVADVVTLPMVRHVVQAAVGVGIAGTALAAVASSTAHPVVPTAAELAFVATAVETDGAGAPAAPPSEPPLLRRLPDAPVPAPTPPTVTTTTAATWTVGPGDHLWSVADRVMAEALGRTPTDAELAPFWRQVVEVNRDRLPDPTNPDLVFPGQELVVPEPPVPSGS